MKKYSLLFISISLLLLSCKEEILKFSKVNSNQNLGNGEWLDSSDTLNGISIRENKIAFFKKMEFNSEDIFKYHIIDSVYKVNETEKNVVEYLLVEKNTDTLKFKIVKRDKKEIILKDSKEITKEYKFWR
ncbi:MAG: hypothetical protein ABI549_01340 [Flavobacterium sp.]|uniref:hypothetical protein n=1 Tax=Flavobacterium sp. TaxID=239 RepID=UPI00326333B2